MNKENGLANSKVELRLGKLAFLPNAGRKRAESERSHVVLLETEAGTLPGWPQPCGKQRFIEMG